jgi:hypothetical protein
MNKVGAFLADPFLYRILATPEASFDLRKVMDSGQVLLVNLAKGKIGEGPAALFGALLMSSISLVGLSRSDAQEEKRSDFFVYGDEFQTYTTLAIANMLAELRKYGIGMVFANQYLDQLDKEVKTAILGEHRYARRLPGERERRQHARQARRQLRDAGPDRAAKPELLRADAREGSVCPPVQREDDRTCVSPRQFSLFGERYPLIRLPLTWSGRQTREASILPGTLLYPSVNSHGQLGQPSLRRFRSGG